MSLELGNISVIIPAYNAERFLRRCLDSVLAQTLAPAEVIVVDDGSTDATADVARRFGERVRYVHQANAGSGAARNRGLEEARGGWIAFQDADDVWLPDRLRTCVELLQRNPALVWCCACYRRVWADGTVQQTDIARWDSLWDETRTAMSFLEAHARHVPLGTPGMLIRRDVLDEAGGFAAELLRGQDTDLWIRIAVRHPMIGVVWPPQFLYMQTQGSVTRDLQRDHSDMLLLSIRRRAALRSRAGDDGWSALRRMLAERVYLTVLHACLMGRRDCLHRVITEFGWLVSRRRRLLGRLPLLFPLPVVSALARWVKSVSRARHPYGYE